MLSSVLSTKSESIIMASSSFVTVSSYKSSSFADSSFGINETFTTYGNTYTMGNHHNDDDDGGSGGGSLDDAGASDQAGPQFDFVVNGIGIPIVVFLGIIGNCLSAIVLSRPQMKSSVTCLLLGLALCDTCLITIAFLIFGLPSISDYSGGLRTYRLIYYSLWVPYLFPVSSTAQTCSVYLTLAVTIERYIAVCHPLKARSVCTWRRAFNCVLIIFSASILYNLPRWFEICTKSVEYPYSYLVETTTTATTSPQQHQQNNETTITFYMTEMCPLRDSSTYKTVYINWLYLIVMYLVPFTGLVAFNWTIYRQVRKASVERQSMSKLERRELGLATMLLFVVTVFLLCNVLPLVNNILETVYETSNDQLVTLSNFLVVFNSSVNFMIYFLCGERFRRQLMRLCRNLFICGRMTTTTTASGRRYGLRKSTLSSRKTISHQGGSLEEMPTCEPSRRTNGAITILVEQQENEDTEDKKQGTGKKYRKGMEGRHRSRSSSFTRETSFQ